MENKFVKLISFKRNDLEEACHYGFVLHLNKDKILNKIGECENIKFYQRSCSKPLQFSTLIKENINEELNLTIEEIALCCASHTGTKEHQKHIINILNKTGCSQNDLLCPPDLPLDKDEQNFLIKNNLPFLKIHNNCSGKHSAMLALCKFKGFDISNYTNLSHPLSSLVISQICELCEVSKEEIIISKDGCTLPTIATTLPQLGKGFLNLFSNPKYQIISEAMRKNPYLAGGKGRIDSEIMNASNGKLIAKVGAGGIIVVVNIEKTEAIAVKIADASYLARSLVCVKSLLDSGWITQEQVNNTPLKDLYLTNIKTETGEIVGKAEFEENFNFK